MRGTPRQAGPLAAVVAFFGSIGLIGITAGAGGASGPFISPVVVGSVSTSEPGINVTPNGAIYINGPAGLLSNLPGSPSFVFKSTDNGATWQLTPTSLRANLPGGGDSNIAIAPDTGTLDFTDR